MENSCVVDQNDREDFVEAMIKYLSMDERKTSVDDDADEAYAQLQFDFPLLDRIPIQALYTRLQQHPHLVESKYKPNPTLLNGLIYCITSMCNENEYYAAVLAQ